ncbi:uncharacterized protein LOC120527066 [Polypterus senegalus]|uniref:uncharacterized protein LOC120527066 n=1 Tax=Polypterus senegalus TaxID=55291 RepID=UPI00196445BF|nr:uncharacterized protein LOC120527066 [Polypterus senegalus]
MKVLIVLACWLAEGLAVPVLNRMPTMQGGRGVLMQGMNGFPVQGGNGLNFQQGFNMMPVMRANGNGLQQIFRIFPFLQSQNALPTQQTLEVSPQNQYVSPLYPNYGGYQPIYPTMPRYPSQKPVEYLKIKINASSQPPTYAYEYGIMQQAPSFMKDNSTGAENATAAADPSVGATGQQEVDSRPPQTLPTQWWPLEDDSIEVTINNQWTKTLPNQEDVEDKMNGLQVLGAQ